MGSVPRHLLGGTTWQQTLRAKSVRIRAANTVRARSPCYRDNVDDQTEQQPTQKPVRLKTIAFCRMPTLMHFRTTLRLRLELSLSRSLNKQREDLYQKHEGWDTKPRARKRGQCRVLESKDERSSSKSLVDFQHHQAQLRRLTPLTKKGC